jgi:hypothetical protein
MFHRTAPKKDVLLTYSWSNTPTIEEFLAMAGTKLGRSDRYSADAIVVQSAMRGSTKSWLIINQWLFQRLRRTRSDKLDACQLHAR